MCDFVNGGGVVSEWIDSSKALPEVGMPVTCMLVHCSSLLEVEAKLIHVDEQDCSWRMVDGLCEISYDYDVKYWRE